MESKDYDLVKQEVELVLSTLNNKQILSIQDEIEIEDHFFCNVEELCSQGMSTYEALQVARNRFGALDVIREDYEVVRPENIWIDIVFSVFLCFSVLQIVLITMEIAFQVFWNGLIFFGYDMGKEVIILDTVSFLLILRYGGYKMVRSVIQSGLRNLYRFWFIPLVYLGGEVIYRIFSFIVSHILSSNGICDSFVRANRVIVLDSNILISLIIAFSVFLSYKLYKMKIKELQYV